MATDSLVVQDANATTSSNPSAPSHPSLEHVPRLASRTTPTSISDSADPHNEQHIPVDPRGDFFGVYDSDYVASDFGGLLDDDSGGADVEGVSDEGAEGDDDLDEEIDAYNAQLEHDAEVERPHFLEGEEGEGDEEDAMDVDEVEVSPRADEMDTSSHAGEDGSDGVRELWMPAWVYPRRDAR
ncbi:hypothetical protein EV122DRAFT_284819 [Schizophyllum commune]